MAFIIGFCLFQLVANFSDMADFVVIYIAEAHPIGGYDFKENKFQVSANNI